MIYYLLGSSRFCTIWNERENGLVTVRYTDGSISLGDFNRNLLIKTNMELKPPKVQTYLQPTLTKMLKKERITGISQGMIAGGIIGGIVYAVLTLLYG